MNNVPSCFGEWLRKKRTEKGLSQKVLGDAAGISGAAVSHYESGRCSGRNISAITMQNIARALGVSMNQIRDVIFGVSVTADDILDGPATEPTVAINYKGVDLLSDGPVRPAKNDVIEDKARKYRKTDEAKTRPAPEFRGPDYLKVFLNNLLADGVPFPAVMCTGLMLYSLIKEYR